MVEKTAAQPRVVVNAVKNPIIPGRGVCDPHVHIFGERAYLFASHDSAIDSTTYSMNDWMVWSSEDLVAWTLEQVILPEDFYMGASDQCWAVDAVEANGKYYLYFSNGNTETGVAVAENPCGPFVDALGRPLLDGSETATREYDPAVFIDDDGTPYLVFGGPEWAYGDGAGYFIAQLNPDMISFAEKPRRLRLDHEGDDKVSVNHIGDFYYLTFASNYAISDNIYGPYHYRGNTGASADHGSYFSWNGQLFNAFTIFDPTMTYRSSGICYVHQRDDGELVVDPVIVEYGVGHYDGRWNKIEAEWYMKSAGITKVVNPRAGFDVSCEMDGSLFFPQISHLKGASSISLFASCSSPLGAVVRLYDGEDRARILATIEIAGTGPISWRSYQIFRGELSESVDVVDAYLEIEVRGDGELRVDSFSFHGVR